MVTSHSRKRAAGFTLIELMIVVAVIAILAAIAYPSYADSVRKGRRGQAKADLLEAAQLAERYRSVNNTYEGFTPPSAQSPKEGTAHYLIAVANDTATTYDLTATPQGAQLEDTQCLALSIDQAGRKTISDSASGSAERCW